MGRVSSLSIILLLVLVSLSSCKTPDAYNVEVRGDQIDQDPFDGYSYGVGVGATWDAGDRVKTHQALWELARDTNDVRDATLFKQATVPEETESTVIESLTRGLTDTSEGAWGLPNRVWICLILLGTVAAFVWMKKHGIYFKKKS